MHAQTYTLNGGCSQCKPEVSIQSINQSINQSWLAGLQVNQCAAATQPLIDRDQLRWTPTNPGFIRHQDYDETDKVGKDDKTRYSDSQIYKLSMSKLQHTRQLAIHSQVFERWHVSYLQ